MERTTTHQKTKSKRNKIYKNQAKLRWRDMRRPLPLCRGERYTGVIHYTCFQTFSDFFGQLY